MMVNGGNNTGLKKATVVSTPIAVTGTMNTTWTAMARTAMYDNVDTIRVLDAAGTFAINLLTGVSSKESNAPTQGVPFYGTSYAQLINGYGYYIGLGGTGNPAIRYISNRYELTNYIGNFKTQSFQQIVINGLVYLMGGIPGSSFGPDNMKVAVYKPTTNTISYDNTSNPYSIPLLYGSTVGATDGDIYLFGGGAKEAGNTYNSYAVWRYNVTSKTWYQQKAVMPFQNGGQPYAPFHKGRFWFMGGGIAGIYSYDPVKDLWSADVTNSDYDPSGNRMSALLVATDTDLYLYGGNALVAGIWTPVAQLLKLTVTV